MKKILFISPTGSYDNGAEISILNLMKFLANQGYKVINVFPESLHETSGIYLDFLNEANIKIYPISSHFWWWPEFNLDKNNLPAELFVECQNTIVQIRNIIKKNGVDLVITNTVNPFQGIVAAALEKVPHITLIHEYPMEEFSYYEEKLSFLEENSDNLFTASQTLANFLYEEKGLNKPPKTFVPYSEIAHVSLEQGENIRLVTIGKINERKNQLELIKAYHQLNRPDIPLILIGGWDDTYKRKCDSYIEQYQLANIHFLGNQTQPWNCMQSRDICIYTSKMETFSMVMIESALNGVPTIYSDIRGHASVNSYFGHGKSYPLGDIEKLVQEIQLSINNFEQEKEFAISKSILSKSKYVPEEVYSELLEVINNDIENKPKSIKSIDFLFNHTSEITSLENNKKKLTIYLANDISDLPNQKKLEVSMSRKDKFTFEIPKGTAYVRIDLSAFPSFYKLINLRATETDKIILPIAINGLNYGEQYLFSEPVPQMLFRVGEEHGQQFELEYECFSSQPHSDDYFVTQLTLNLSQLLRDNQSLQEGQGVLKNEISEKQQQIALLELELSKKAHQYNSVISSRRWTIPTKIINFFRGKNKTDY